MLVRLGQSPVLLLLLHAYRFPGFREATSQEENVTRLEFNFALGRDLLDLVQSDWIAAHPVDWLAFLLRVGYVVDQKSSSGDAILSPVANTDAVTVPRGDLVGSGTTIPPTSTIRNFGTVVAESVPLR